MLGQPNAWKSAGLLPEFRGRLGMTQLPGRCVCTSSHMVPHLITHGTTPHHSWYCTSSLMVPYLITHGTIHMAPHPDDAAAQQVRVRLITHGTAPHHTWYRTSSHLVLDLITHLITHGTAPPHIWCRTSSYIMYALYCSLYCSYLFGTA